MAGFDPLSSIERLGLIRPTPRSAPAQFAGGNQQVRGGELRRQQLQAALENELDASINRIRERLQSTYTASTAEAHPADGPGHIDILA